MCSEARALDSPGGQADRHMYRDLYLKKKKKGIGNSITSIPQWCVIMMADLCGPSSQEASRELFRSAGVVVHAA